METKALCRIIRRLADVEKRSREVLERLPFEYRGTAELRKALVRLDDARQEA